MIKFPKTEGEFYQLSGGLDLVTPAIALPSGRAFDAQNYEPEIAGGYRRIDGYERFDGQPGPTKNASYALLAAVLTAPLALLRGINGATSGRSGRYLGRADDGRLILGAPTGAFVAGENLFSDGVLVGRVTATSTQAETPDLDADLQLMAVNNLRSLIQPVPGSGPLRGVWVLNDVVYAFRDNAAGTAGDIYKSTGAGWVKIALGQELQFTNGTSQINVGDTITNAGGASGVVVGVAVRTGAWNTTINPAVGTLFFATTSGTFATGNPINVLGAAKATAAGPATPIVRAPGGHCDFTNYNFNGSAGNLKIYGCDGVNYGFEFDGAHYFPIRTGMTVDAPSHLAAHKNYLFFSFKGSLQFCAVGQPFTWSAVLGAGEIGTGDNISGLLPLTANQSGSAMAVFTHARLHILYPPSPLYGGTSPFELQTSSQDMGFADWTMQTVGAEVYGLTARGVHAISTTQAYGDFSFNSVSHLVQPWLNVRRGRATASVTLRNKSQYRIYFDDGTALVVGLTGSTPSGVLTLNYGIPVRCICASNFSDGTERTFFGSDDGYVYEDGLGTSFDGGPIEAWLRLASNHSKSPRVRKRYRRAVLEAHVESFCKLNVSYDLGYGNPDVAPPAVVADTPLTGGQGGYWDQFNWDQFIWDSQVVVSPSISLDGTEKNISLVFYSNRAQDSSHTLQGVTLLYTVRRIER